MRKLAIKFLAYIGLTTIYRQNLAEERAEEATKYAHLVTQKAEDSGDLIVAGDYVHIRDTYFKYGRRLIVAPWSTNCVISGLFFDGEKS